MICKNSKSVIAVYSANVNLTKETSNYQDNINKKFEKEAFDSLDYNKKKTPKLEELIQSKDFEKLKEKLEEKYKISLESDAYTIKSLVLSSNNKFIITGSEDHTVRIWNFFNKSQEGILKGHKSSVLSLAITNDNSFIVSGSEDKTIRVWDFFSKKQESLLIGHEASVTTLAITKDNNFIISGSSDKTIRIWNFVIKPLKCWLKITLQRPLPELLIQLTKNMLFSIHTERL